MRGMRWIIFAALAALLSACGGGSPDPEPVRVFIFAGQSNMLGADSIIAPSQIQDLKDDGEQTAADANTLFAMGGAESYDWSDVRGHNSVSNGQEFVNGIRVKGHGPEVGFARALGGNIAIVKYADNYEALENGRSAWVKPGTRWTASANLR